MIQYSANPFKHGIDSVVTALTLFDCDGNEIKDAKAGKPEDCITFTLPLITNQSEVSSCLPFVTQLPFFLSNS